MKISLLHALFIINGFLLLLNGNFRPLLSVEKQHAVSAENVVAAPSVYAYPPNGMLCNGSLGENIFEDGDFGSGAPNVLTPDPQFAPGYFYQTNPPPNDGFYTITNSTINWGSFAATNWFGTEDNSEDPNGYMMVVNASFDPGIFYENVIEGLCENTLYEFTADVINIVGPSVPNHIKPNVSFLLDDEEQYTTGDVPQDATWRTYGFSFFTGPTTNSLKLTLRNNAPGGIGNDLALDNITFRACGPQVNINTTGTLCEDDSVTINATIVGDLYETPFYQWQVSSDNGASWTDIPGATDDSYLLTDPRDRNRYRFFMANSQAGLTNPKCRVVSTVETLRVVRKFNESRDTICEGLSYEIGTSTYSESGVYIDSLISPEGCDSIVTTFLTVLEDTNIEAILIGQDPFCPGDPSGTISVTQLSGGYRDIEFSLDGGAFTNVPVFGGLSAGDYNIRLMDAIGCDAEIPITLSDPPELRVVLPQDVTIELGDSVLLDPFINQAYQNLQWSPPGLLNCDTCASQYFRPLASTGFDVTVSNSGNCVATDDIAITVVKRRNVFVPNAFSPNDDEINDYFKIYTGNGVAQVNYLRVFNRWGALLYSKENPADM
ncbi:MAG: gliding motility-associated C-terminal domain-containing protein, partial [Bacteroidota bacterium]